MSLPSAAAVAQPRAWGYDGRLDDLLFRLAAAPSRPLSLVGEAPDAPRVQTEALPEEFVSEFGLTFARSDFSGGEGLYYAHRRNAQDNDVLRFFDSKDIVVVSDTILGRAYATVQYDTADVSNLTNFTSDHVTAVRLDDNSVLRSTNETGSNQIERISDPLGTPSQANETVGTVFVRDVVRLGDKVYADCVSEGVYERSAAGGAQTWSQLSSTLTNRLWAAKGRLFGCRTNQLYEYDLSTGATTTIITSAGQQFNASSIDEFNSVIDAGSFILAASWDGYIYAIQEQSGTLTLVGQTQISTDEFPAQLGYHSAGVLLVLTRQPTGASVFRQNTHLYTATINDTTGILENVQLIHTFYDDGVYGTKVGRVTATRNNLYFVADAAQRQNDTVRDTSMWRYDVTTDGLFRDLTLSNGTPGSGQVLFIEGEPVTAMPGYTWVRNAGDPSASGDLILPLVDFYTASNKQWLDVTVEANNVDTDGQVAVWVATSEAAPADPYGWLQGVTWTRMARFGNWGTLSATGSAVSLSTESRWLAIRVQLIPGATELPELTSIKVRAQVLDEDFVIDLPVNISDRIEAPGRQAFISPGWGRDITDELLSLRGSAVTLELYEPPLTAEGIVEAVRVDVPQIPEVGAATETATVRFRGRLTS